MKLTDATFKVERWVEVVSALPCIILTALPG